jgi:hypothetical protein
MEASEQATYDRTIEQLKDMLGDDDYEAAHRRAKPWRSRSRLSWRSALGPERLLEVDPELLDVLEPDAQPDEVLRDSAALPAGARLQH